MKLSDFNYKLPKELIAQEPTTPRDHSRLLIYNRKNNTVEHKKFYNIVDYLNPGDILFLNDSKVFPARLQAYKKTGGGVEIFLLKVIDKKKNIWECLIGGRIKLDRELKLNKNLVANIIKKEKDIWQVSFNQGYLDFLKSLNKIGQTPLPPYIKREWKDKKDLKNYQTIYANDKKLGSSAAPTAGLHFTNNLLNKIKLKGVEVLTGTLHVGPGTFSPIKEGNILDHQIHSEEVEISLEVINKIITAKKEGQKIIAVGTTSTRILESLNNYIRLNEFSSDRFNFSNSKYPKSLKSLKNPKSLTFSTNIFIYPGYKFQIIDSLITNFHLPQSSLLLLVSALIGREKTLEIYQEAINKKYRFFSYGDAMVII